MKTKTKSPQTLVTKLRADIDRHQRAVLSAQRSVHFHKTAIRAIRGKILDLIDREGGIPSLTLASLYNQAGEES